MKRLYIIGCMCVLGIAGTLVINHTFTHNENLNMGMRCMFCNGTGFKGNFNCFHCNGTGRNNNY